MKKDNKKARKQQKDTRRSGLLKAIGGSLLLIALGVLLLLRPDFGTATVASVLGWIMIVGGAICITVSILNWDTLGLPELLLGVAVAVLGIFIVVKPLFLAKAFGMIIGIYLAIHGIVSILEGLKLKKFNYNYWPSVILGLVMVVLALVLALVPMSFSQLLMRIVGGFMALCGLTNLMFRARASKNLRKPREIPQD